MYPRIRRYITGAVTSVNPDSPYTPEEHLAVLLSGYVRDWETSACGMVSPVPAAGLILAEQTHAPHATVIILGSEEYDPFRRKGYSGSTEFHFMAQRGDLDLFFVSGIQIDQEGNFNLHVIGDYEAPRLRLPGAYGTGLLYYMAKRVVLFRTEHSRRTFVERVDFVTAAGSSPENVHRPGGPVALVTTKAVFDWETPMSKVQRPKQAPRGEWVLRSMYPGTTVDEVLTNMEFRPRVPEQIAVTAEPSTEQLRLLRTVVREKLMGVYPEFATTALREA